MYSATRRSTYIGDLEQSGDTLRFTLPDGASDLEFQEGALGGRFVETPGGFADTSPVVPGIGSQQVLFSYDLDFDAPEYEFVVTNYYSVTGVNVLVSDPTATVDSPVLKSEGLRNMQGQDWLGLVGKDLAPHQMITLTFANLPLEMSEMPVLPQASVPVASRASTLTFVVLGLVLFGLGVLVGYKLPRGEDAASPGPGTGTSAASGASGEDDLIVALADLDDAYERGELPPNEYQAQREELKRQLTERFGRGRRLEHRGAVPASPVRGGRNHSEAEPQPPREWFCRKRVTGDCRHNGTGRRRGSPAGWLAGRRRAARRRGGRQDQPACRPPCYRKESPNTFWIRKRPPVDRATVRRRRYGVDRRHSAADTVERGSGGYRSTGAHAARWNNPPFSCPSSLRIPGSGWWREPEGVDPRWNYCRS